MGTPIEKKKTGGVDAMRQTPARTSTIRYGTHDASCACKASVSGRATDAGACDDRRRLRAVDWHTISTPRERPHKHARGS